MSSSDKAFQFCGQSIGVGQPPFLVAEVGFNHNADVKLAKAMIQSAAESGADAVKLQTFVGSRLYANTFKANDPENPETEIPFYQFFERYELSKDEYKELFAYANEIQIPLFSAPFDEESLDMLVELGMPAIKIASGDLTCHTLLKHAGKTGLPVVLSTGMGDTTEIAEALESLKSAGCPNAILLHCISNYPATVDEMNLACIPALQKEFDVPVGLSDHTMGFMAATVATSLGAVMIEKHFTLDRKLPGVDQGISMEPRDLVRLREDTRSAYKSLGDGKKVAQASEENVKPGARRSVVSKTALSKGQAVTEEMLSGKRPGTGIPINQIDKVIGRIPKQDIPEETVLTWEMFQ